MAAEGFSVGASGPHDFAVRVRAARLQHKPRRRSHRVRNDRDTPLVWDETAGVIDVIWVNMEPNIFANGTAQEGKSANGGVQESDTAQRKMIRGPPHIHVYAGFPAHEIGAIIRHLRPQRDVLEGKWHEHFAN